MKTIRMPRRMGEITERLPKAQYDEPTPTIKRTNSLPSGLAEADTIKQGLDEKKKPDFIRGSTNSIEPLNSHKSQSALLEIPHKAIIRSSA